MYSRLKQDNPNAVVPEYRHIRFLGVDSVDPTQDNAEEQNNLRGDALRDLDIATEMFSIANTTIKDFFQANTQNNGDPVALQMRPELSWIRNRDIPATNMNAAGAGGIRQIGRLMMVNKAADFIARVKQTINEAKSGLNAPAVNIHIISGLGGATGSGCFLDVCYMVQQAVREMGGNANIFGYFFLPDVNLSAFPAGDTRTRQYISKNGYAAMQELDYCMQLQHNGGGFVQKYPNHIQIEWNDPPVDMCHLICATDANNSIIQNAYEYAMNVVAEYVLNFLTASENNNFDLSGQPARFSIGVHLANTCKTIGAHLRYCTIGAASASIPFREINTYLASELFKQFSCIEEHVPTEADVDAFAASTMGQGIQRRSELYDSLWRELFNGFSVYFPQFEPGRIRDLVGNDAELVDHYTFAYTSGKGMAETNARNMMDEENQGSLINRIRAGLDEAARDLARGPMFAHRLLSAAERHNLLNIIGGLIDENKTRWDYEAGQRFEVECGYAKHDFHQRKAVHFKNYTDKSRFNKYRNCLNNLYQSKLLVACYEKMDEVLHTLRRQVEAAAVRYGTLGVVVGDLVDTFKENRDALASPDVLRVQSTFSTPMITIDELRGTLGAEVRRIDVPGMLDEFMRQLLEQEEAWIARDENKITKLVNDFFVDTVFQGFTNRTITAFLKAKYNITADQELENKVYQDWILPLTQRARPLFYFNPSVWPENQTSQLAFVSYPKTSGPIKNAVEKRSHDNTVPTWLPKESALTDRIFVMNSTCVLPLSAYGNCAAYERDYFSAPSAGCHYYEGFYEGRTQPRGMLFTDWRKLPSLTPQSHIKLDSAPEPMKAIIGPARDLYDEAVGYGLLDGDNRLCQPDEESLEKLREVTERVRAATERFRVADTARAQALLEELQAARVITMVPTRYTMANDGHRAEEVNRLRVQKDYFVSAPAYQIKAREILSKMKETTDAAEAAGAALEEKIRLSQRGQNDLEEYCNALFSGVISFKGRVVTFTPDEYSDEIVLSQFGEAFPFKGIPVYQAFVNYKQLLSDEHRKIIRKRFNDMFNAGSSDIETTGKRLKEEFTEEKIAAWARLARSLPEAQEISEFIRNFMERFETFCLENGI